LIFGIASLLVSIASYTVSKDSLTATEATIIPNFTVNITQSLNPDTQKYDDTILYLSNHGGVAHNIIFSPKTFIRINQNYYLPIIGYFFSTARTGNVKDKILISFSPQNNKIFHDLYMNIINYNKGKKPEDMMSIEIVTLSVVKYADILNKDHSDYFLNETSVPQNSIGTLLETYEKSIPIDILNVTPEIISNYLHDKAPHQ
jgi:hypothetical protein